MLGVILIVKEKITVPKTQIIGRDVQVVVSDLIVELTSEVAGLNPKTSPNIGSEMTLTDYARRSGRPTIS